MMATEKRKDCPFAPLLRLEAREDGVDRGREDKEHARRMTSTIGRRNDRTHSENAGESGNDAAKGRVEARV